MVSFPSFSLPLVIKMSPEIEPALFGIEGSMFLAQSTTEDNRVQKREDFAWGRLIACLQDFEDAPNPPFSHPALL